MEQNDQHAGEYTPEQLRKIFQPQYLLQNLEVIPDPEQTGRFAVMLYLEASDEMKRQEIYRETFLSRQTCIFHSTEENLANLIQQVRALLPPTKEDQMLENQETILEKLDQILKKD